MYFIHFHSDPYLRLKNERLKKQTQLHKFFGIIMFDDLLNKVFDKKIGRQIAANEHLFLSWQQPNDLK